MKTINLSAAWSYRSPLTTIDFGPGEHEVDDAIAAAFEKEEDHGRRHSKARAPRRPDAPQG